MTFDPDNPDIYGVTWIVTDEVGFWDGPTPRLSSDSSALVEKINRHGAMMGPNFMQERIITLNGVCFAPDQGTLSYAVTQMASLCTDPYQTYQLCCDSQLGQIYANVRLDAQTQISPYAMNPSFKWSMQLIAPDPRKYTRETFNATIALPQITTGDGMDFSTPVNNLSNPQFATNITGWTAMASTTLARVTALPGTFPIAGVTTGATATSTGAAANGFTSAMTTFNPINDHLTYSGYFYATAAKTLTMTLSWYNASSALVSSVTQSVSLTANTWTQGAIVNAVPPTNATQYTVSVQETATASGSVFYATALDAEYTTALDPYTSTLSGVNYGAPDGTGLNGGATGLSFGASNSTGFATLSNNGTAPAIPVYTLYGPLTSPVLTATASDGTTSTMKFNGTLNAGDVVVIDPSAPSVLMNGQSRRYMLSPANFTGFAIPPINQYTGQSGTLKVGLSHNGAANAGGYATAQFQWALF